MKPRRFFCPWCEAKAVSAIPLGFVDDSGQVGTVEGFACASCRNIWEAPGGRVVVTGHVDLGGRPALEVILDQLVRRGCDPRPVE